MSEAILNEALANITISALSLNLWHDFIEGKDTRVYNVYHFQRHLNFFLPYGLCLLCALPIVVLGILALRHNGVSAIDGGFLQVLMTTATGQTKMEVAAADGCLGGHENVPDTLKKLRVRFGELITTDQASKHAKRGNADSRAPVLEDLDMGTDQYGDHVPLVRLCYNRNDNDEGEPERTASQVEVASSNNGCEPGMSLTRRTGFGDLQETIPLCKGSHLQDPRPPSVRARSVWKFALPG
ncbi:hypothetical protein E8E12_006952 [Didymella heteroderae]|uniref:Uncharacterized protein n=1 Tax=Didymella heteroderae TaxID=1769908 RepID=A0A9P4WRF8_9PLEO|nr:hypothetical protein E8E12_006952 [Didymella heteroderae]